MLSTKIKTVNLKEKFIINNNDSHETVVHLNGIDNSFYMVEKRNCYNYCYKLKRGGNYITLYRYVDSKKTEYIIMNTSELLQYVINIINANETCTRFSNIDYMKQLVEDNLTSDLLDFITDIHFQIQFKIDNNWYYLMNVERVKKSSDLITNLNVNYNNYQVEKRDGGLKVSDISNHFIKRHNRGFDYNSKSSNCRFIQYRFTIDNHLQLVFKHRFNYLNNMFNDCIIELWNYKYNEVFKYRLDSLNDLIKSPTMIYHEQQPCNFMVNDRMINTLCINKKQITKLFELQLLYNRVQFNVFDFNFKSYNKLIKLLKNKYDYKLEKNYYIKNDLKGIF